MRKVYSNLILVRLLIVFVFMIIPVAVIGITFINRSIRLQEDQLSSIIKHNLISEMNQLTGQMETLQQSLFYLADESDINILTSRPNDFSDYQRYQTINYLSRRLYTLQMSTSHVYLISSTIPAVGKTIRSISYNATSIVSTSADIPEIEDTTDEQLLTAINHLQYKNSRFEHSPQSLHYYYYLSTIPPLMEGAVPRLSFDVSYNIPSITSALQGALPDQDVHFVMIQRDGTLSVSSEINADIQNSIAALIASPEQWHTLSDSEVHTMELARTPYYMLRLDVPLLNADVLFYVSRDHAMGAFLNSRIWLYVVTALCAFCILLYSWYAYTHVQIPVNLLLDGFRRLEKGDMEFQIDYEGKSEFHLLVQRFNKTLNRLKAVLGQLYDQKILTQEAEMKHLQAQINPHFLYNNFYILDNMILMEDYDAAAEFCRQLGGYFRYVTRSDQITAPLYQEIDHAKAYVTIQQVRFPDTLTVDFPPPPEDLSNPTVPRLILQPILENAFKHALEQSMEKKALSVHYHQDDTFITITIENNGPIIEEEEVRRLAQSLDLPASARTSTGLSNVHQRLKITHGTGLTLSSRLEGGLCVELKLQRFITKDDISNDRL